jgi:hypothetical protein
MDSESITLFTRNNNNLRITGVVNNAGSPPGYLDDGTVHCTIYDSTGQPVPGATNLVLVYEPGSTGNYSCDIFGNQFQPEPGAWYYAVFQVDEGSQLSVFYLEKPVCILERSS